MDEIETEAWRQRQQLVGLKLVGLKPLLAPDFHGGYLKPVASVLERRCLFVGRRGREVVPTPDSIMSGEVVCNFGIPGCLISNTYVSCQMMGSVLHEYCNEIQSIQSR